MSLGVLGPIPSIASVQHSVIQHVTISLGIKTQQYSKLKQW
jgi:hypothetical protein